MLRKLAMAGAMVALAGCASLPGARPAPPPPGATAEAVQAAQLASYVSALQTAVQGSPAEQAEVLAAARSSYEQAHQGPAVLRYALLLAVPGHPGHDPQQAQALLREALARPELLSPIERALALVEAAQLEQEIGLATENSRLVAENQQERDRQRVDPASAALARRLQDEIGENTRLHKELDEALAKLEAIATIERNVPDRQPPGQNRKQ